MHSKRRSLNSEFQETAAQKITHRLTATDAYLRCRHLAAYIAVNGECNLQSVINTTLNAGKSVYLPIITKNRTLKFSPYTHNTPLRTNRYGIPEPDTDPQSWINTNQLDLICVPLLAFDVQCNRIGMGGGYYDRTLIPPEKRNTSIVYIGIGYELQKVERLLPETWDIPMDFIVTEKMLYSRK